MVDITENNNLWLVLRNVCYHDENYPNHIKTRELTYLKKNIIDPSHLKYKHKKLIYGETILKLHETQLYDDHYIIVEDDYDDSIVDIVNLKENVEIKSIRYDFTSKTSKKIHIDILMAIYTYNNNTNRYSLTENLFKHYKNIQKYFSKYAIFTFTIIGSELDISKNLATKYFGEDCYFEFDQELPIYKSEPNFYRMLHDKINFGFNKSYEKKSDIIMWIGSNDYICFNFFKQILEEYNPNLPQVYNISNFFRGRNALYYCYYDNNKILKKDSYWHNGYEEYCNRDRFKYSAPMACVNRQAINLHPEILQIWNCDEGFNLEFFDIKGDVQLVYTKNLFCLNIKTISDNEQLHPFDHLKELNKYNILDNDILSVKFLYIFYSELNYFNNLLNNSNS